jgi:hypothetical protein
VWRCPVCMGFSQTLRCAGRGPWWTGGDPPKSTTSANTSHSGSEGAQRERNGSSHCSRTPSASAQKTNKDWTSVYRFAESTLSMSSLYKSFPSSRPFPNHGLHVKIDSSTVTSHKSVINLNVSLCCRTADSEIPKPDISHLSFLILILILFSHSGFSFRKMIYWY